MATQFIGSVVVGTGLDTRGFAVGVGKLRSAASAINGPLNAGGSSASSFARGIGLANSNIGLLNAAGRISIGIIHGIGSSLMAVGRTASVVSLTTGLVSASILKAGFNWRKTWNQARAVTDGTADDMGNLEKLVFKLGSSTKFTVSQVAGAVTFLGKAGNSAVEQLKLLPTVLSLATAAGVDLPRTADLMTNIAKGLRIPLAKVPEYADKITAAFLNSNVTLEHFAASSKKIGPLIAGYGLNFTELATSIGLLGNAGIQGEESGVHLRRGIINLSDTLSKMRTGVVERLGLTWEQLDLTSHGYIKTLGTIAKSLLDVKGKFKNQEAAGLAARLFGARALPTHIALLGQLGGEYDTLSGKIENSGGVTERVASEMIEGLEPFYRLQAAIELIKIKISESGVLDTFANLADRAADLFGSLADTSDETKRLVFGILTLVTVGGPAIFVFGLLLTTVARVGQMFFFLASIISFVLTPLGLLTVALLAIVGAAVYMGLKGVEGIQSFFDGSSPLISSLADAVLGLVGFVNAAISGDWNKAWGYAKDVIANAAVVVVLVMSTLANTLLSLLKNIVHFFSEHWNQISDGVIEVFDWLFDNTKTWMVIFTLLMFKGIRNMAVGVVLRMVWMANKLFAALIWFGGKTKLIWGPLWSGILLITKVAAAKIVAVVVKMASLLLLPFIAIGTRIKAWIAPMLLWLAGAFLTTGKNVVGIVTKMGNLVLIRLASLFTKIGIGMAGLTAVLANPWVIAGIAVLATIAAAATIWRDELADGLKGMEQVMGGGLLKLYVQVQNWARSSWGVLINLWNSANNLGGKALDILGFGTKGIGDFDPGGVGKLAGLLGVDPGGGDANASDDGQAEIDAGLSKLTGAFDSVAGDVEHLVGTIVDFGGDIVSGFEYVGEKISDMGFNPADWVSAIADGDWERVGELAVTALDSTVGEAFRFLASVGGDLAKSVLAPVGKAAIEAALGGLGYIFTELDVALQDVKALEDIDAEKVKAAIYAILGGEGTPSAPIFSSEQDRREAEKNFGVSAGEESTPEERKKAAIDFITTLVGDLKQGLADLFKVGEDGKPAVPEHTNADDLLATMNSLGYDVTELGKLWKDINYERPTGVPEYDPTELTSNVGSGGSSTGRSLSGALSSLSLRILVQIGDQPFEDAVVSSLFSAKRGARLEGLGL